MAGAGARLAGARGSPIRWTSTDGIRRALLALSGVLIATALLTPSLSADVYEIQPGDTLSGLAQRFGVSQGVIRALNPGLDDQPYIYAGQEITLPDNLQPLAPAAAPLPAPARLVHTVQPNDTLSALSALYNVPQSDILAFNPSLDPDLLFVGAELVIRDDFAPPPPPATAPPAPGGAGLVRYLVQPGDTVSALAARFGIPIVVFLSLNPELSDAFLLVGQEIVVPADRLPLADTRTVARIATYVVEPGDSASAIAAAYGLSLAQLVAANPGVDLSIIYVGQSLQLPLLGAVPPPVDDGVATPPRESVTYEVRPGDSARAIAQMAETNLDTLRLLNPGVDLSIVFVGQSLTVPRFEIPPPPPGSVLARPPAGRRYVVQSGDTLTAIAASVGLGPPELAALNPGINPDLLSVGQAVTLPGTEPIPIASRTVATDTGDTLEHVAARLGVLPHTLLANNPSLDLSGWIPAGTVFRVPNREGVIVTVRPGDTLSAIAAAHGSSVGAILADPRSGVTDSNQLILGQEVVVPITVPDFIWPVAGDVTDGFGVCRSADCSARHRGLDIGGLAFPGGPVAAIAEGTVTFAGGSYCCGLGFYVEIEHANGWISRYAHLAGPPPVATGQRLAQGALVGYSGSTGFSTGVHLHLELEHHEWFLDALNYLP